MSDVLPPEITLTEMAAGARYRLPPRPLGRYHGVGLVLLVLGLVLCLAPGFPAWKVMRAVGRQIPAEEGLVWMFGGVVSCLLCRVGLFLVPVGLFILAGHSEIELRSGTLYARECCGPVRWTWARATAGLRRFFRGAYRACQGEVVLAVTGDTLTVRQVHLFGGKKRQWRRREVADVFVEHYPGGADAADQWELQIHAHAGNEYRLLGCRDRDELRWLATRLRRALGCVRHALSSPPQGFVVRSPLLALRFPRR